ncbi:MAG TPA: succinate--CoA ligase subunit alpha [Armatimonadota bacterium]
MSILVDENTRVLVQGITGREGEFHTRQMLAYGTRVVAGVTPGKGGQTAADSVPVFNTVKDAVAATGANAACVFVPKQFAPDAVLEATEAGIPFTVLISEYVPINDMIFVVNHVKRAGARLLGGNCPGVISPGKCKIGIMPGHIHRPGPVGVVSRSGTLTYEIVKLLTDAGLGQTTVVGIGGDPILGTSFADVLPLFEADPDTRAVVMVGEIGGSDEEDAMEFARTMTKPVVGFIGGRAAPAGKRMGHAGAIISGRSGGAQAKVDALLSAGIQVVDAIQEIPSLVGRALS